MPGTGVDLVFSAATASDSDDHETRDDSCNPVHTPEADTVSYSWGCSGGTPHQPTNTQTFTWTAPTTGGDYAVTCTVDDGNDGNRGADCLYGTRDDPSRSDTNTAHVRDHPHPTHFRQYGAVHQYRDEAVGLAPGEIGFNYTWDSTSGVKGEGVEPRTNPDLDHCWLGERVDYLGMSTPTIRQSLQETPWAAGSWNWNNPTAPPPEQSGVGPLMGDIQHCESLVHGKADSFTGQQRYIYYCDRCMTGGGYAYLTGVIEIVRSVMNAGDDWYYSVSKSGATTDRLYRFWP